MVRSALWVIDPALSITAVHKIGIGNFQGQIDIGAQRVIASYKSEPIRLLYANEGLATLI